MGWMNRLANLVRPSQLDRELEEEMRFHLDARTRDNRKSGMHADEARLDAIRRFGNQPLAKELTRERDTLAWLESLGRDLVYGFRNLRRCPGFTSVAVLVMGLGIGANTAMFTLVNGVLLRPLPFPESHRIFQISYWPREWRLFFGAGMVDSQYLDFHRRQREFESIATFASNPVTLTGAGDPVRLAGAAVTTEFLEVLRVQPAVGRSFAADDIPEHVVLLGDTLWRNRFAADPAIVGRTIALDGIGHTVVGIMPRGFAFPPDAELWTQFEVRLEKGNSFTRPVIGRLKPGVSPAQAQAAFDAFTASLPHRFRGTSASMVARVQPLQDVVVGPIRGALAVFTGAVAFVLLIACANLANLLLIRAASRRHEITTRAALGAGRWRLVRQLLTESLLIGVAGGVAGLLLARAGVPVMLALAPAGRVPRASEISMDGRVLLFSLGLSVLTALVFGVIPALRVTRRDLARPMADAGRWATGGRTGLRGALVVAEMALALILLTGAGLLLKSFWRLQSVDPGFHPNNTLAVTVDLPDSRYRTAAQMRAFHQSTLEKLAGVPGVEAAGAVNWVPFGPSLVRGDFQLEDGRKLPAGFAVDKPVISPDYLRALGIRLVSGRAFLESDDSAAPGVVLISQAVARRLWPGEDPLGRRISMADKPKPGDWLTIVGVVDDIRQRELTDRPSAAVYLPYRQVGGTFFLSHMSFIVRTASDVAAMAPAVRRVLREVDADQPVDSVVPMPEMIAATTAEPRFRARVIAGFSVLAVLLAAIGIYGVLAYSVAERTREIGIRVALGATTRTVASMVLGRTVLLAAAGVVIGTVGSLALTRVLRTFLFEVEPTDPAAFLVAALVLVSVALASGVLPARRAAAVDPLIALRCD
jgi:putative ABC transport system permease protein